MNLRLSFHKKMAVIMASCFILGACSKEPPPPPPPQQPPVVINLTTNKGTNVVPNNQIGLNQQTANVPQNQRPSVRPQSNIQRPTVQGQAMQSAMQPQPAPVIQTSQPVYHLSHTQPQAQRISYEMESLDEASFFNTQIHEMALQLLKNFRGEAGPNGPIAVTTFVDLNNLYKTSPFGRYIAEQLMGELQRAGFSVVEIRKTESLMLKPKFGEYGLSRDIQEIARSSSASYVLTGTYITRGRFVLINARLVSNENNLIASSGLKILRRDPFIEKMLWPSTSPVTTPPVRVPIKELGSLTEMKIMSGS